MRSELLFGSFTPETKADPWPVLDDVTGRMTAAWRRGHDHSDNRIGPKECNCGARVSGPERVVGPVAIHPLAIHYLAWHRAEVPAEETDWLRSYEIAPIEPTLTELAPPPASERFRREAPRIFAIRTVRDRRLLDVAGDYIDRVLRLGDDPPASERLARRREALARHRQALLAKPLRTSMDLIDVTQAMATLADLARTSIDDAPLLDPEVATLSLAAVDASWSQRLDRDWPGNHG